MEKLKVGIIGTGRATSISKGHLWGYQHSEGVELIGVFDLSKAAAEEWCDTFGLDRSLCYDSWERLVEDADIVSVCTPNFTHADYICACLQRNTNVLCEKPVSSTVEDIPRIREAMANTTALSMVNLNYRQIPGLRMLRDLLSTGELGPIYTVRHNMGGSRLANEAIGLEWRFVRKISGSGALGDFGSHALDILCYVTGCGVDSLRELSGKKATFIRQRDCKGEMRPVENDDCAMLLAELPGGGLYNLTVSRVGSMASVLEIVTAKAMLRFELGKPDRIDIQRRADGEAYGPLQTVVAKDVCPDWHTATSADVPYLACAESAACFVKVVRGDRPLETGIDYGISILEALDRIDRMTEPDGGEA